MKTAMSDIKIYLLDRNIDMCSAWKVKFGAERNVEVVFAEFTDFMRRYKVDGVVSPANSFGIMDGGYDEAIISWFGPKLMARVQQYILDNFYGEQPVASSFVVSADDSVKLIHTPTMRYPGVMRDPALVYHCMRSSLIAATKSGLTAIVVPAFGAATGCVEYGTVAEMTYRAYKQLLDPPTHIDWEYASKWKL